MEPLPTNPPLDIAPSEQDQRTRARILRAAVEVFDRKGYASASVREIVEKAGVTKPALYYHFGSKEGVLVAILNVAMQEFEVALTRAVLAPGDARTRLLGLCSEVYRLFGRHASVMRVAHTASVGAPEGAPPIDLNVPNQALAAAITQIVEEGVRRGELRQVLSEDLGLIMLGIIGESIHQELHGAPPIGEAGMRRAMDLVFEGVIPKGAKKESGEQ